MSASIETNECSCSPRCSYIMLTEYAADISASCNLFLYDTAFYSYCHYPCSLIYAGKKDNSHVLSYNRQVSRYLLLLMGIWRNLYNSLEKYFQSHWRSCSYRYTFGLFLLVCMTIHPRRRSYKACILPWLPQHLQYSYLPS